MNFNESMNYINSFSHSGKKVEDLSRISGLLELLDNPHKKLKFVHIAGTNGKGSVLEYCSNACINANIKTGQFTSPYIINYCDRIRINGKNIPEKKVAEICTKVKSSVNCDSYSQFEITFAIAMLYFVEENCDIVFLETGIGGTLDATNVIESPLVCVVTSVSLDHMAILGNTVEEIATHKLGIIKENSKLVLSSDNTENIKKMAEKTVMEKNGKITIPNTKKLEIIENNLFGTSFRYKNHDYKLKMTGEHQVNNAITSIETLEILKSSYDISNKNISDSLSSSFINSRIEVIKGNPTIIIDGGHNRAGIDALLNLLKKSNINKVTAIFGMVEGKSCDYAIEKFSDIFRKVYCVDGYINNSISAEVLSEKFRKAGIAVENGDYRNVWDCAVRYAGDNNTILLVCGSLYLASAMKIYSNERK